MGKEKGGEHPLSTYQSYTRANSQTTAKESMIFTMDGEDDDDESLINILPQSPSFRYKRAPSLVPAPTKIENKGISGDVDREPRWDFDSQPTDLMKYEKRKR